MNNWHCRKINSCHYFQSNSHLPNVVRFTFVYNGTVKGRQKHSVNWSRKIGVYVTLTFNQLCQKKLIYFSPSNCPNCSIYLQLHQYVTLKTQSPIRQQMCQHFSYLCFVFDRASSMQVNNINDQLDATITILLIFESAQNVFGNFLPIFRSVRLWFTVIWCTVLMLQQVGRPECGGVDYVFGVRDVARATSLTPNTNQTTKYDRQQPLV